MSSTTDPSGTADLLLTHVFDAPRAVVWDLWTQPNHLEQWWGPHDYTTRFDTELRAGGKYTYKMIAPDGQTFPSNGTYEDVVPLERFVEHSAVEFEPGKIGIEERTIITFEDEGEKTRVTIRQSYLQVNGIAKQAVGGATMGWTQSFEKLEDYILSF